ncbi:MAG: hypothetical protein Q9217_006557 [Psora testacea]
MAERRSFHDRVVDLVPDYKREPSIILAGVLKEERSASGEFEGQDFLWIKCKANTSAERIHQQYEARRLGTGAWILRHEGQPVDLGTKMANLNTHCDDVVAFEAVKASDTSRPFPTEVPTISKTPTPLSPKNANARMVLIPPPLAALSKDSKGENATPNLRSPDIHMSASPKRPSTAQPPFSTQTDRITANDLSARQAHYTSPYPTSKTPQLRPNNPADASTASAIVYGRSAAHHQSRNPGGQYGILYPTTGAYSEPRLPTSSGLADCPQFATSSEPPPHATNAVPAPLSASANLTIDEEAYHCYYSSWIGRFKAAYPRDTQAQIEMRLAQSWLSMGQAERDSHLPQKPANTSLKIERQPSPARGSRSQDSLRTTSHVDEPHVTAAEMGQQKHNFQLSAMLKDATPQMLEASVEASVELLNRLKAPLLDKMANSLDAEQWIQQIDSLTKQAAKTKTVIGVVGNTGAGKSSVINAMLDEERLVPTNCMRACTAVVTEISYNHADRPYRAEIEFISLADWEKELRVLFQDLLDGDGKVIRECANEDTDAGVAYAKIKAVYPHKSRDDLANSNIQTMLQEVSHILGSSRDIQETDSLMFYRKLQSYVDSKEKSTGKKDKAGKKDKTEREFWPLIRVVRLYVRSPTLATGAVIVDLPGVHDANAARAAVAESYMKQCTGLWIVAPINRAVDDKAAKSLLGESFKRQLKMDGGFNAVTFICSKTDDISLMEAQESLGLDEQLAPSWDEIDRLSAKQKHLKKQMEEMRETKAVYEEIANDADEHIEVWESLRESVASGKVVFAPTSKSVSKKRKNDGRENSTRKKRKTSSSDIDDSDFINDDEHTEDGDKSASENNLSDNKSQEQRPLTQLQVDAKLQELKTTKKDSRAQKREIVEKSAEIRREMNEAKDAEKEIESRIAALCISGRNQYSKGAIQLDFAAGIKELDQEIAAEEDEENFNPDVEARDYDAVARTLPVFCVSSRGYQKLKGRLRKDPGVPGFTSIEETEIPQLQAHCEKLTETGRAANCRTFINKLSQLLNSLTIWASSDGTGANLTAEQKAREAGYLQKELDGLETGLENAVKTTCRELNDEFGDSIFDKYETAVQNAVRDSIETTLKWGAPVNRGDRAAGGLYWATYKAICRRDGCFKNAQGSHDWNYQLTEPMIRTLASGWEKVFSRRVQHAINTFTRTISTVLQKFHRDTEARLLKTGTSVGGLSMLSQQVGVYEQILKDLAVSAKDMTQARQKDINREFVPVVAQAMQEAYTICQEEYGPGCFARMKAVMNSHVAHKRHAIFQDSVNHVKKLLNDLLQDVETMMADKTDEVFVQMKRDYRSVLGGGEVSQCGEVLPRVQRQVRKEVMQIVEGVEKMMSRVVGIEVEEAPDEDKGDEEPADGHERKGEDGETVHEPNVDHTSPSNVEREASPSLRRFVPTEGQASSPGRKEESMEAITSTRTEAKDDQNASHLHSDEAQQPMDSTIG